MRRSTRAALAALGLLLLAASFAAAQKAAPASQPTVIFAVEAAPDLNSHWMEPVATLENGDFHPVPVSCDDQSAAAANAFFTRYLAKGRSYPLLFGSRQVGKALPTGQADPMGSPGALADLQTGGTKAPVAAMATDSVALGRRQGRRHEPTPAERQLAAEMAKQIFREHKVSDQDLARLHEDGIAAADLEGHGELTLIATFVVPTPDGAGIQDSLFFAVKPAAGAEPSLVWYDHPQSVAAGEELLYVDQLPLRPGEPDDILVHVVFYRNSSYRIYRFHIINWRPVFETPIYGCL
ncbi:MAG TPA: hypothetical protein VE825_15405 [Terriglobales bacterium]|nr:hypothetical protein [Terriglobales bacterium]